MVARAILRTHRRVISVSGDCNSGGGHKAEGVEEAKSAHLKHIPQDTLKKRKLLVFIRILKANRGSISFVSL